MVSVDLSSLARLYGFSVGDLHESPYGGNYNKSYRFERNGEAFILRVSPPDADPLLLKSSMDYLAEHFSLGSPVVKPIRSAGGRLVEEVALADGGSAIRERRLVTVTKEAPGRIYELLARDTISDDLFFEIGRSLAAQRCTATLC